MEDLKAPCLSWMSTSSVISSPRRVAGRPEAANAPTTAGSRLRLLNCAGEIFTARVASVGQPAAAAQACRSTHSPIGTIRPVSSAIGMKLPGWRDHPAFRMMPADQRLAAGDHWPVLTSMIGW